MSGISLFVRNGRTEAAQLEVELKSLAVQPALVWIEPRPGLENGVPGALRDFPGIWRRVPALPHYLNELRLCWPESARHYVAQGTSLRWVEFSTRAPAKETFEKIDGIREDARNVEWRHDLARRFGRGVERDIDIPAAVRTFWKDGRMLIWWLVERGSAS